MAESSTARSLKRTSSPRKPSAAVADVDTSYLETLTGYNARRAALTIISVFLERMAQYQLRPVDFSVLSLIAHNPGITSRQLCGALDILPPNLVGMLRDLESRGVIEKREHPTDRRAQGLHLGQGHAPDRLPQGLIVGPDHPGRGVSSPLGGHHPGAVVIVVVLYDKYL